MKQRTIKEKFEFEGIGLHSGEQAKIEVLPAGINHGIKFSQIQEDKSVSINADIKFVSDTERATVLSNDKIRIQTVEHLLAALYGMKIDNALIEITGNEVPILDGSATPFSEAIQSAGTVEQDAEYYLHVVEESSSYKDEEIGFEITMLPSEDFSILCFTDFGSEEFGPLYAEYSDADNFHDELAPARTFVFVDELTELKKKGLIKGGSFDNALVLNNGKLSDGALKKLAKQFDQSDVNLDKEILNPSGLRFNNEIARHKLLDFLGDLSLLGVRMKGRFIIKKPGHTANVKFLQSFKKDVVAQKKLKGKPIYNPLAEPVYDINAVTAMLPHRFPFLLVDKIIELTDTVVVGVKNVTMNEQFFQGHFPGNPIFPGVLQMEAMAQTGGILVLSTVEDPQNWDTYFLKLDGVKFKQKVLPGDTLIIKMELLSPVRRGLVHMQGRAYVGNKIVSEGELTAQIVKRTS